MDLRIGKLTISFKWDVEWKRIARKGPEYFIQAIKEYRASTGAGLKESKDAVEAYLDKIGKSRAALRWLRY